MYSHEEATSASLKYFNGNDLSADVFIGKYALRDNDANLLERTPTDMHHRLAGEFARVQAKKYRTPLSKDAIFNLLDGFKTIIPQGSPMSGIGNTHQYVSISNCFDENTKVFTTNRGVQKISNIKVGDKTITADGTEQTITQIHKNLLGDRKVFSIKCYGSPEFIVTENHQFVSISREQLNWGYDKPVDNTVNYLRVGDYIAIPKRQDFSYSETIDLSILCVEEKSDKSYTYEISDSHITVKTLNKNGFCGKSHFTVNRIWNVDENFAYFLGLWYGDGCIFSHNSSGLGIRNRKSTSLNYSIRGITFTFNKREQDLIKFVSEYGSQLFGIEADVNDNADIDGSVQIVFHSFLIGHVFESLFGRYCSGKKLYNQAFQWNRILIDKLIQGLVDSDGCITANGGCKVVLNNQELLTEFYHLSRSWGYLSRITYGVYQKYARFELPQSSKFVINSKKQYADSRVTNIKKNSRVFNIVLDGYTLVAITKKTPIKYDEEYVYTLGVDNVHSYSVEGLLSLNCFVLPSPDDSYGSILNTDQHLVQISKRRGGVGIDLTKLRPKNFKTTNAARTTTGIVSWMERYSSSIREVGQNGRRGALMLTLSVHHPDILDFATVKNDDKKVTGANISVRLTDEFLNAVKHNQDYQLRWPEENPIYTKMVSAREVWKVIIHSAWLRAEPGLLFWNNIVRESPADLYVKSVSTNPCLPKTAVFLTKDGLRDLASITIGDEIWSAEGWTRITHMWSTGINEVYKYTTTQGSFYSTDKHKVVVNGEKIYVGDTEVLEVMVGPDTNEDFNIADVMDGLVLGDGSVHKASNNLVYLNIGSDDSDYFTSEISPLITEHRPGLGETAYEVIASIHSSELPKTYNRVIPDRFFYGNSKTVKGFLRGLYSANGSICGGRVTLKATSRTIIHQVQQMLSSIGIRSYFTTNKESQVKFKNGEYVCKKSYDLNITRDRMKFVRHIGFLQGYKNLNLSEIINKTQTSTKPIQDAQIIQRELVSGEEVFDLRVDNASHTYWCDGFNVSNCSEIPMPEDESCRLLLLNLFGFVIEPFTSRARFDWKRFYNETKIAQRLMDDIVDLEVEAIDRILAKIEADPESEMTKQVEKNLWVRIRQVAIDYRRTGLGYTALGDTIAGIGIKYGTEESIDFAEKIAKVLKFASYETSAELAEEFGPFKGWNYEKDMTCPFMQRFSGDTADLDGLIISGDEILAKIKLHGRRNIANLTNAPCGSVSIESKLINRFGTTSGIEAAYSIKPYTRRKKINPGEHHRVDFVDQNGDSWQNYDVFSPNVLEWQDVRKANGLSIDIKDSPWYDACAEDLNWVQRVKLQGAVQKHIDHAISSTINLPNDVTEAQVAEIYEAAWEHGLKGVTIYRDGCRTGVLVKKDEPVKKTGDAAKRPSVLPANFYHSTIKGQKYLVAVGLFENKPYEVFAGKTEEFPSDINIKDGYIKKNKRGHYSILNLRNEVLLENINELIEDTEEALTRMTSTSLRHNIDLNFIVHQLEKISGDFQSFGKVVARALKKYIVEGTRVSGEACPDCGEEQLRRENGCVICRNCGASKCS